MLQFIQANRLSTTKVSMLIAFMGSALLLFAYISQHVFDYEPCTLCIEIRFWISSAICAALLSALLGLFNKWLGRSVNVIAILGLAAGVVSAIQLSLIEKGYLFAGCTPFTLYQSSLPLHEWWPAMYEVQGLCGSPALLLNTVAYSDASALGLILSAIIAVVALIASIVTGK